MIEQYNNPASNCSFTNGLIKLVAFRISNLQHSFLISTCSADICEFYSS